MTMTRWWWIRHAPVTSHAGRIYGNQDVDCDCSDEALFRSLAAQLPGEAVWVVTPLSRTRATAEAIVRHHGAAPANFEVEPRLAEQDFGDWQGLTHDELAAQRSGAWHRFWLAPAEEVPPGGESFADVSTRVGAAIQALTRRHAGRDIVCVSHGGPIRAALGHALKVSPEQALAFAVDNCALTRLDHFAATDRREGPSGEDKLGGEKLGGENLGGDGLGGSWRIALVNARMQLP